MNHVTDHDLNAQEREALSLLSDNSGTTTCDLAQQMPSMRIWSYSRSTQSNCTLQLLRRLEAIGLVKRMDAEKPIVWMLSMPAGEPAP